MAFERRPASPADLAFARELTCRNMLRYYIQYDLLWQDEGFDAGWAGRESWLIVHDGVTSGFFSLSRDARAIYIRELQVAEAHRRQGAGAWAIGQVAAMARQERRPAVRLTVFKSNPARNLYERQGFAVQGEDECFLRMELDPSTLVL
ncbi:MULTISPECIES: N-acetyltransferase [unclassified Pseudomonas]|uniref:GNAT family N-acetyltransferase n=1 Tax=unclassified Pseudomonas TaxID=196821 RepID=UPI000A1E0D6C|nr:MULTISPECIES: GNAT family N-acetyltransferase [unclassified Pseudomonas]